MSTAATATLRPMVNALTRPDWSLSSAFSEIRMNALPIQDVKQVDYRSTVPGVTHACGHDVHTTILLGAGKALAQLAATGDLPGRVRLLFQPAEEATPCRYR